MFLTLDLSFKGRFYKVMFNLSILKKVWMTDWVRFRWLVVAFPFEKSAESRVGDFSYDHGFKDGFHIIIFKFPVVSLRATFTSVELRITYSRWCPGSGGSSRSWVKALFDVELTG